MGRNFLTPGHPGVKVRNVRRKFGAESLFLHCFFCSFQPAKGGARIGGVWNGQISGLKFTFQGQKFLAKSLVCWLEAEIL